MTNRTIGQEEQRTSGWEHHQIDLAIDPEGEGPAPIYTFAGLPLRIHGILEAGTLVDLMLSGTSGTISATPLIVPQLSRQESELDTPLLSRSWRVAEQGLSVHAEVWIDRGGRGFADLFVQRQLAL